MKQLFTKFKKIPFEHKIGLILSLITTLSAIAGLYLIVNAASSLKETKKADQGNFILTLNRDFFFNDRLTQVRAALETDQKILTENGGKYDDVQLDDYIGFFDTLSGLIDRRILDDKLVDENFGYYIKEAYDNQEVKAYIKGVEKNTGKDVYMGFEMLGKRISKEGY